MDDSYNNGGIKGVFIEAAGDVRNDGTIYTDKDAIVGIKTGGNYISNTGKIIQGEEKTEQWWEKTWVQAMLILIAIIGVIPVVVSVWKFFRRIFI